MKVDRWSDNLYDVNYVLLVGKPDATLAWLTKRYQVTPAEFGSFQYGGKCVWMRHEGGQLTVAVALVPQPKGVSWRAYTALVAHECLHATYNVLDDYVGMPLACASQEAYCYYQQWMFQRIVWRLERWNSSKRVKTGRSSARISSKRRRAS